MATDPLPICICPTLADPLAPVWTTFMDGPQTTKYRPPKNYTTLYVNEASYTSVSS